MDFVTEKQFMEAVLDAARSFAWMAYHTFDSRRSTAGFPDLILCKPPNPVLCVELKTEKGSVTIDQQRWLSALSECIDIQSRVWRPSDLPEIVRVLSDGRASVTA